VSPGELPEPPADVSAACLEDDSIVASWFHDVERPDWGWLVLLCVMTRDGRTRDVAIDDTAVIAYLAKLFDSCGFAVDAAGL
jgi:hypothetical protein